MSLEDHIALRKRNDDKYKYWNKDYLEYIQLRLKQGVFLEVERVCDENEHFTYDELVEMYGIKRVESINFKQHQDCKLFRCLECWLLIHPDDNITPFKDGFIHKLCDNGQQ